MKPEDFTCGHIISSILFLCVSTHWREDLEVASPSYPAACLLRETRSVLSFLMCQYKLSS